MQKYDAVEKGITSRNTKMLKEAIGSICYTCRDFSNGEFDDVVRYVESKGIKIKDDSLVGSPTISSQKSNFSDEDFAKAVYELKKNFCDERINDVKIIGKHLYASKTGSKRNDDKLRSSQGMINPNQQSHPQALQFVLTVVGVVAVIVIIVVLLVMM